MKLRELNDDHISGLIDTHFGVAAVPRGFMAGEIAVNVDVDVDPTRVTTAPPVPAPDAEMSRLVLKAEFPSTTMTPEHADWICGVQQRALGAGLPVARQVAALHPFTAGTGKSSGFLAYAAVGGEERALLRLQEFLSGDIAAVAQLPNDYPEQLGELVAGMVMSLVDCQAEPTPIFHPWAFETTGANVRFAIERIRTLEAAGHSHLDATAGTQLSRDLALAWDVARAFDERVKPLLDTTPRQVVHQDINDFNVLIKDGAISGLLDFGDCRTAPRMAELAIACAYVMLGAQNPQNATQRTVDAYARAAAGTPAELSAAEVAALPLAAMARLCLNACMWTARTLGTAHGWASEYGQARMVRTWPVVRACAPAMC